MTSASGRSGLPQQDLPKTLSELLSCHKEVWGSGADVLSGVSGITKSVKWCYLKALGDVCSAGHDQRRPRCKRELVSAMVPHQFVVKVEAKRHWLQSMLCDSAERSPAS